MSTAALRPPVRPRGFSDERDQRFYFWMSLVIGAVVVYGFSRTVDANLLRATPARPAVLYAHGFVFSTWLVFFVLQSALVRGRQVRLHRRLGWFGAALAGAMLLLGGWTAVAMGRVHGLREFGAVMFLSFSDITTFAVLCALGIAWRRRPDVHRRVMFLASCVLTSAGFARFPMAWLADRWTYVGVDALILTGVVHDQVTRGRLHRVYAIALPVLLLVQAVGMYVAFRPDPHWMALAARILR